MGFDLDSRCQSFTAQWCISPISALLDARRDTVTHRATRFDRVEGLFRKNLLSYVADPPRGFASYLEKVMKRQWVSRRDTKNLEVDLDYWAALSLSFRRIEHFSLWSLSS